MLEQYRHEVPSEVHLEWSNLEPNGDEEILLLNLCIKDNAVPHFRQPF